MVGRQTGRRKGLGLILLQLSFFFKKVVVCGVSLAINETLKWPSLLPILMQESFWWWQCSDRYIISLFLHLHTPSPISLMVSVDIKHHVYLPTYITVMHHLCWKIQNVFCKFALLFLFIQLYSWFTLPIAIFQKKSVASRAVIQFFIFSW